MGLNDNLEAFWKLDEASGSRLDSGPNGRTLTDNNTVTQATGKVGNAAQFTAANSEYLSAADAAWCSFGNESFTVAGWIYLDSAAAEAAVCGKNTEWRCTVTTGRKARLVLPSTSLSFSTALSLSTWYFVVWQYDAAADLIRISVNNGTPETAADSTGATDSTNELRLGRLGSAYFDGRIDALGIWRRALSSDEITQLYNAGAGLEPPFITAHTATLSETLIATETISKGPARTLTETATASEAIAKATARSLAESSALAAAAGRGVSRLLSETATLDDAASRALARSLADSMELADALTRALSRAVAEALGFSDTRAAGISRAFVDAYAAADGRLDQTARVLQDSLGLSDSITAQIVVLFGTITSPRTALLTPLRTTALLTPLRTTELT